MSVETFWDNVHFTEEDAERILGNGVPQAPSAPIGEYKRVVHINRGRKTERREDIIALKSPPLHDGRFAG